jgi:hypothetical protein
MVLNIVVHFPRIFSLSAFTILTFRVKYVVNAFRRWKRLYFRNPLVRFGGYIVLKSWIRKFKKDSFLTYLSHGRARILLSARKWTNRLLNRPVGEDQGA